jgi:hypothetical protein
VPAASLRASSTDATGGGGGPPAGVVPGGLLSVEDAYDSHPAMLPLVQLMERAAALSGDASGDDEVGFRLCGP